MSAVFAFLGKWFLASIPIALLVGAFIKKGHGDYRNYEE